MRLSFLGGGTDQEEFFNLQGGFCLNVSINKYVYVLTLDQPKFVDDKFKFTYRKTESVSSHKNFEHPVVREILRKMNWQTPLNIATMADLPGNSGLGSSSAFTCALIANLMKRDKIELDQKDIAREAIEMERKILNEPGGWQDQISTAYGGLRAIEFSSKGFKVSKNLLFEDFVIYFSERSILLRLPSIRVNENAALMNSKLISNEAGIKNLNRIKEIAILTYNQWEKSNDTKERYEIIADGIKHSWILKSQWGNHVLSFEVKNILDAIKNIKIDAFKTLGSGDAGFALILASPSSINKIRSIFSEDDVIDFNLTSEGTKVIEIE